MSVDILDFINKVWGAFAIGFAKVEMVFCDLEDALVAWMGARILLRVTNLGRPCTTALSDKDIQIVDRTENTGNYTEPHQT